MAAILPLKRYDLQRLMRPYHFPTDTEDGIESVNVEVIELVALNACHSLALVNPPDSKEPLHSIAKRQFGIHTPLDVGYYPSKATLCICFKPEGLSQEGKILPITITGPHRCDLEDKTEDERLIGEKYFKRWNLLKEKDVETVGASSKAGISLEDFKILNWIVTSPTRSIAGRVLVDHFAPACYRLIKNGALVHIANCEQIITKANL